MRSSAIQTVVITFLSLSIQGTARCQVGRETTLWKWTAQSQHHQAIVKVSVGDASATGVLIEVDHDKPLKNGGFEGLCLTAYHVVEAANKVGNESYHNDNATSHEKPNIRVKYRNGCGGKKSIVLDFDKELDVAILLVWVPEGVEPAKLMLAAAIVSNSLA